jgi:hypothetical protein
MVQLVQSSSIHYLSVAGRDTGAAMRSALALQFYRPAFNLYHSLRPDWDCTSIVHSSEIFYYILHPFCPAANQVSSPVNTTIGCTGSSWRWCPVQHQIVNLSQLNDHCCSDMSIYAHTGNDLQPIASSVHFTLRLPCGSGPEFGSCTKQPACSSIDQLYLEHRV